ncbi:BatA bacteroides aerotolerance operon [Vibrio maritimus]|uniref:BatA bacteroides aerotolerance operon n=1 Tax=Vibrio maritimus TaxID=990268 RepID=A0A090TQU6_9VIBR|nr:BatA bacteroides aerotolerance operon [Vibrio maritimus]
MIEFKSSWAFLLLFLPVLVWYFAPAYKTTQTALRFSFFSILTGVLGIKADSGANQLKPTTWQKIALIFGWSMLVLAMAQPVMLSKPQTREVKGRDLMVVVDLSGSMDEKDFVQQQNEVPITRLEASQQVLSDFSKTRDDDRLGLIVFGDNAYLQTPFTADLEAWRELLTETRTAMAGQNTHLGDAIGLGIKHFLDNGESEQKVMLVVTDGNDTDSLVPPIEAAKVAAQYGIRIHLIAIGDPAATGENQMDMDTISEVAKITGGNAFLAISPSELKGVTDTISALEPSLYQSFTYQVETSLHYIPVLLLALNHLLIMWVYSLRRFFVSSKTSEDSDEIHIAEEIRNEF